MTFQLIKETLQLSLEQCTLVVIVSLVIPSHQPPKSSTKPHYTFLKLAGNSCRQNQRNPL